MCGWVEGRGGCGPQLWIVATVSGDWLDAGSATSAGYWARHLRAPVRFARELGRLVDGGGARILLEVGPRTTLCTLSRQHPGVQKQQTRAVATLADAPDRETAQLRLAAGQRWCHGVAVDPAAFDTRNVRRRVRLPTYPFERKRYWVDAVPRRPEVVAASASAVAAFAAPHAVQAFPVPDVPAQPVDTMDRKPPLITRTTHTFEVVRRFHSPNR